MAKLVSKTYGDALFDLALEEEKIDVIYEEICVLKAALPKEEELKRMMAHPGITKEDKIQLAEDILKEHVSKDLTGFIVLLISNGRFQELDAIFAYFIHLVKEHKKIGVAYVESAIELTKEQQQQVVDKLLETTEYESFEMHFSVKEDLMGGMLVRINDRVVDSSIKTKLQDLSKELYNIQLSAG